MPKLKYSDEQIDHLTLGIYMDLITASKLPKELYLATADVLLEGLYEGYGKPLSDFAFGTPDYALLSELRNNVYIFSGAKTYQQYKKLNSLITEDNERLSYKVFKEKARQEFGVFNETYLHTEFETAITSATTAQKFNDIQENIRSFPFTRYSAVRDGRTSEICLRLDGVTLPSNDKFWHSHVPPQHFNCRCILETVDRFENPDLTSPSRIEGLKTYLDKEVLPVFKMNPAIDKYVFSPKHPYFDVAPQDEKLAHKNFNLPIPKNDRAGMPVKKSREGFTPEQKQEFDALPRLKLSPEDMRQQERSLKQYVLQKKQLTAQYLAENGNITNTDEARKLFDGYKGTNAAAVQEASSMVTKEAAEILLANGTKGRVAMYAGGAGSGKSSAIDKLIPTVKRDNDLIVDGNMANPEGAINKINKFIGAGKEIDIHYVYRDAVDAWEHGVIQRMLYNKKEMGRIVPMSVFMENTTGSLKTVQRLYELGYDKVVKINVIDNSLGKGNTAFMDPKKLKTLSHPDNLKELLLKKTKELREAGKISEEQYRGLIK